MSPSNTHVDSEDTTADDSAPRDFIRDIVYDDLGAGRYPLVVTRFPPEPNGYLHIGHAKSICLNFGIAEDFSGRCHLRFDDTNPTKEEQEYIDAIQEDVRWLGFDWGEHLYYTSDYFEQLYDWAEHLINQGLAYVDDLTADEIREHRGTLTEPGTNSPYRDRAIDDNINLRDPVIYRIMHAEHPRTGSAWCIYPNYDFAHGQSDAIENITHSICTLEFEDHRPLYDWLIENLPVPSEPHQYEFARLNLTYTVLSKRHLMQLVSNEQVEGWDDPRMPTISGYRRRGYPAAAIRDFASRIGVSKANATVEVQSLEACVRENLNENAERRMAVLKPLKVMIENYPEDQTEELDALNNPNDETAGSRKVPFSREFYIERDDFMEDPPKKFFRLAPGREVRLRYAYFVTCTEVIKDDNSQVTELRCTYDPATKGGNAPDGRKVKATLHWVSAEHAIDAQIREYEHLFTAEIPGADGEFLNDINPDSLTIVENCKLEPALQDASEGETVQFERVGYFCLDKDTSTEKMIFNKTIGLRDTWAKTQAKS